jgi:N-acetylmuramoyl-L-alanine amidase
MLLDVGNKVSASLPKNIGIKAFVGLGLSALALACAFLVLILAKPDRFSLLGVARAQQPVPEASPPSGQTPTTQAPAAASTPGQPPSPTPQAGQTPPRQAPSIVVLDPAHGGTDLGARGTGGIRESEIVLQFAAQVRTALESEGFQVMQTRQANENPSFDDRSAIANAQRGAVFVSLHIGSTGLPGTVRVYVMSDLPASNDATGLIPWDRAQAPFLPLSRRFGDIVQGFLSQRFKGSPSTAQAAAVRQLRTTAAPAIAVEVSSVSVEDRNTLDRMAPGVADAIARGSSAFRPLYVVAAVNPGDRP